MNRRDFMAGLGLGTGAALITGCNSEGPRSLLAAVRSFERRNEKLERWLFSSGSRDRIPPNAKLAGAAFPSYFISDTVPVWDTAARGAWRLQIDGAVRRPVSLSLDDLVRMRGVTQRVNHYCVEGWNARAAFRGVRLSALAALVQPTADARYVDFQSFDQDYHESWDMESAMHPQTIVVYGRDGHYLNPLRGAPARVHCPAKLGYKNTKYLTRIVFLPSRNGGYWSDKGYEWYGGV